MEYKTLNISESDRKLLEDIQNGEPSSIMKGLVHPGAFYRVNSILCACRFKVTDPPLKIYLDRLKTDDLVLNGYKVSEFAIAALDILGLEIYAGGDPRIRALIKSKFEFD